jgi:hypothetical protein
MTKERAIELGGKEWKGGANHRVYFNRESLITLYGLEGLNVINGRPRKWNRLGEPISNNKVFSLLTKNAYYDVVKDKMVDVDESMMVL